MQVMNKPVVVSHSVDICYLLASFQVTCFLFRYAITLWYFDAIEREEACRRHKQECKYQVAP